LLSGFEGGLDGGDDGGVVGRDLGREAVDDVAVAVDEELLEVPEDAGLGIRGCAALLEVAVEIFAEGFAAGAGGFGFGGDEGRVEGMGVGAGDGDLRKQGKVDAEGGAAEGLDVFVGAWLLAGEVVCGEAEDDEAGVFEAGVELSRASYCGVRPHLEATLTMRRTFPR